MKVKIIVLTCITALFVCLPGCQKKQRDEVHMDINMDDGKTIQNGTAQEFYQLEAGQTGELTITVTTESGELSMTVVSVEDPEKYYYRGNDIQTSEFTVILSDAGEYKVWIQADDFVGSYACNWYVDTGEKMSDDDTEAEDSLAFDIQALYVEDESSVSGDITFVGITDSEYATHMLITVNHPITDFSLWEIEMAVDENGDFIGVEKKRIASTEEVTPEKSVLVTAELGEVLPTKGISFVDQEGNRRHYYLTLSGKDGSAIIAPYDITDTVESSSELGS